MKKKTPQNVPKPIAILNVPCALKSRKISASLIILFYINIFHLVVHLCDSGILENLKKIYTHVVLLY